MSQAMPLEISPHGVERTGNLGVELLPVQVPLFVNVFVRWLALSRLVNHVGYKFLV